MTFIFLKFAPIIGGGFLRRAKKVITKGNSTSRSDTSRTFKTLSTQVHTNL